MKRMILAAVLMLLILCGCSASIDDQKADTTAPTPAVEAPAVTDITSPPHSKLYIPDVSVEDVITYFNEVCLDAEFVNSGDPSRVQKWVEPIVYSVIGEPTDEDLAVLNEFVSYLNTIKGFPGMYEAGEGDDTNLSIYFVEQDELLFIMGDAYGDVDGAVTFWYEMDMIYDATICIRTEIGQTVRNSVIQEEIYNGLGPIQDTELRSDSMIYAGYSEPQELTEIDELILQLLYHPDIECGMTADECEQIIRNLYY